MLDICSSSSRMACVLDRQPHMPKLMSKAVPVFDALIPFLACLTEIAGLTASPVLLQCPEGIRRDFALRVVHQTVRGKCLTVLHPSVSRRTLLRGIDRSYILRKPFCTLANCTLVSDSPGDSSYRAVLYKSVSQVDKHTHQPVAYLAPVAAWTRYLVDGFLVSSSADPRITAFRFGSCSC